MQSQQKVDCEQAQLWNGSAGKSWVEIQPLVDRMFQPFEELLVQQVTGGPGPRVLDVGCGTGATTLAIARGLGGQGACTGIDISEPMLALARARAENEGLAAEFIRGDAQRYSFAPEGFDQIVSRFGVMFFDDPVEAFANLRRSARSAARLCVLAWRRSSENPFMTTAARAAAPLMPEVAVSKPEGPGQFAFADQGRVRGILEESGWTGIDIRPLDVECRITESELVSYFTTLGPLGMALREVDEQKRADVIKLVRPAFDRYVVGMEVRFTVACWMIAAQR